MSATARRSATAAALVLAANLLAACAQTSQTTPPASSSKTVKVVATTTILCDLTRQIAGATIDLTCLLAPGVDAHTYAPVPEDRKAVEKAQLILYSGYNFAPNLIKLVKSTSNPAPKIAVAEKAVPQPLAGTGYDQKQGSKTGDRHISVKKGVVKPNPDPHVWQDAQNGAKMVKIIQQELGKLVPDKASTYKEKAQTLEAQLTEIDSWIGSQIATIPPNNRRIVTTHDTMAYYAAAYGIPVEGTLQGLSTEEKATAARVRELVESIKSAGVPTIFAEVTANSKLLETVAREAKVKISERPLYSDSLGELGSEGDSYQKMLVANTHTIVEGLGGKSRTTRH